MQDFIREVDPDIIIGYNICKFDMPYLIEVTGAMNHEVCCFDLSSVIAILRFCLFVGP